MPGIYGTPSPLARSLSSSTEVQLTKGKDNRIITKKFLSTNWGYIVSIFAAQYLNSGIFP